MKLTWVYRFFDHHPLFTTAEFAKAYCADGTSYAAARSALQYYERNGHLLQLRRGVWHVAGNACEPCLLATELAPDAVFAYDGALKAHGLCGAECSCTVTSASWRPQFCCNETLFRIIKSPLADPLAHTCQVEVEGRRYTDTTPARTLVDCMDRLDLSPGFLRTFSSSARPPTCSSISTKCSPTPSARQPGGRRAHRCLSVGPPHSPRYGPATAGPRAHGWKAREVRH